MDRVQIGIARRTQAQVSKVRVIMQDWSERQALIQLNSKGIYRSSTCKWPGSTAGRCFHRWCILRPGEFQWRSKFRFFNFNICQNLKNEVRSNGLNSVYVMCWILKLNIMWTYAPGVARHPELFFLFAAVAVLSVLCDSFNRFAYFCGRKIPAAAWQGAAVLVL